MDIPPSGPTARPILATPIPGSIPASVVPLDAAGRINVDLPCKRCGYNLRTMMPDGRCPECATAVGQALHGDYLKFADPAWVQKLASGINWIIAGTIIAAVAGGLIGVWFARSGTQPSLISLFVTPLGFIALFGYWRVTSPDPSGFGEKGNVSARILTRYGVVFTHIANPLIMLAVASLPQAALLFSPLSSVLGIVVTIATYLYARQLALRIPDTALAKGFRITMWGMVALTTVSAVFAAVIWLAAQQTGGSSMFPTTTTTTSTSMSTTIGSSTTVQVHTVSSGPVPQRQLVGVGSMAFFGCGGGVLALVFGLWSIILVLRLRKALNLAAEQALHSWAAIPVGQNR